MYNKSINHSIERLIKNFKVTSDIDYLNIDTMCNSLKSPISNEPRYFDKIITIKNITKSYRFLIYSSYSVDDYKSNYFINIVIRPIHYIETDNSGKTINIKTYSDDDTQYLKAYTSIDTSDKNKIFLDGSSSGLTSIGADFAINIDELRGIKLGSLALNAIMMWAKDNFPERKFKDLNLMYYTASIDNYSNKGRRDRLYTSVGFDILDEKEGSYLAYSKAKASEHNYINSDFGFLIYRVDNEILVANSKYIKLCSTYKEHIVLVKDFYYKKIRKTHIVFGVISIASLITGLLVGHVI